MFTLKGEEILCMDSRNSNIKKVHIGLKIDRDVYDAFRRAADKEKRSMAGQLKKLLVSYLESKKI